MSDGRYRNKNKQIVPVWLIPVLAAILVLLVVLVVVLENDTTNPSNVVPSGAADNTTAQTDSQQSGGDTVNPGNSGHDSTGAEQTGTGAPDTNQTGEDTKDTDPTDAPASDPSGATDKATQPTQTGNEDDPQPPVDIVQQADADYEEWLSAAMIMCVSMEYPDFELDGIYAASSTSLEEKYSSDGAYIVFTAGGTKIAIHSIPIDNERSASGTVDISSEMVGYATFDKVDPASLDVSALEELTLDDLSELISQSLLVSIYSR